MIKVVRGKLHGIRVTNADLNYHGSITLDPDHCNLAGICPLEFVEIWNKNSGARISTYVIFGEAGSRCCILNGAAARTCQVGDEVIIAASEFIQRSELGAFQPVVLTFNPDNSIQEIVQYRVSLASGAKYEFSTLRGSEASVSRNRANASHSVMLRESDAMENPSQSGRTARLHAPAPQEIAPPAQPQDAADAI